LDCNAIAASLSIKKRSDDEKWQKLETRDNKLCNSSRSAPSADASIPHSHRRQRPESLQLRLRLGEEATENGKVIIITQKLSEKDFQFRSLHSPGWQFFARASSICEVFSDEAAFCT